MRHEMRDSVTSGGQRAPRGTAAQRHAAAESWVDGRPPEGFAAVRGLGGPTWLLVAVLVCALGGFAALAHGVVDGGRLVEFDVDAARWVVHGMPTWAERLARPFTWLGGWVGTTIVVAPTAVWLARRRQAAVAMLLAVVALGTQILVSWAKNGYARQRPDVGSAIPLPSSFSFPSGHAANGVAVFGLLGLIAAMHGRSARTRWAMIAAGFLVGVLIGWSRVVLNVHYVSDVLAGTCLGLAWLSVCLLVARLVAQVRS
jgi:undecaprenyl-diphosphatase